MPLRDLAPFKVPRRAAATQVAALVNIPAPVGGLNLRDPISEMAPTDAVILDNMIPRQSGVQMRKGFQLHIDDVGFEIKSLMSYTAPNPNDNKLFACADGNIYDVTSGSATVAVATTGSTDDLWWGTQFTASGDTFLLCVSPGSGYYTYSTATGWVLRTPTNLPTTTLRTVFVWKERVFFTAEADTKLYYLTTAGAVTGTAASFSMGHLLKNGGYLSVGFNWTTDAGLSVDDYLVIVGSEGDVGIWQGTDPSSTTTFELKGIWYIGPVPKYGRYHCLFGGDVMVLSELGLIQMSRLMNGQFVDADPGSVQKIQSVINPLVTSLRGLAAWDVCVVPNDNVLVIKPPQQPTGVYQQYGMNIITGSWCTFSNLSMNCMAILGGVTYFGDNNGCVYKVFHGNRDNVLADGSGGDLIEGDVQTSFQSFGTPGVLKKFGMARPVFIASAPPAVKVRVNVQYSFTNVAGSPSFVTPNSYLWDTGIWNTAIWSGTENTYQAFAGVAGMGYYGALRMKVRGLGGTVFSSTHMLVENGGVMATAPAYTSSLIEALRNAVSDQGTPSGVVLLPNSKNVGGAINFVPRSRTGMTFEPPKPGPTGKPPVPPPSAPPVSPPAPVSPRGIEDLISIDPYGPQPRRIVTDDSDPYGPDVGPKRPDGGTDTDLATELGLTQQIDDFVGPQFLTGTTKTLTPNVTVNEVDVTDTPAPQTDPADDFEIDRELGIVQQSDLFDGNNKSSTAVLDGGNTIATAPNVTDVSLDPDNLGIYAYLLNDDVSSSLPAVVADTSEVPDRTPGSPGDTSPGLQELDNNRTGSTSQLSDQDLLELALFDLLSKQRLVGGGGPFETSVYREK